MSSTNSQNNIETTSVINSPFHTPEVNIPHPRLHQSVSEIRRMMEISRQIKFQEIYANEQYRKQLEKIWEKEPYTHEFQKYVKLIELRDHIYNQTAKIVEMIDDTAKILINSPEYQAAIPLYLNKAGQIRFPSTTPSNLSDLPLYQPPQSPLIPIPAPIPSLEATTPKPIIPEIPITEDIKPEIKSTLAQMKRSGIVKKKSPKTKPIKLVLNPLNHAGTRENPIDLSSEVPSPGYCTTCGSKDHVASYRCPKYQCSICDVFAPDHDWSDCPKRINYSAKTVKHHIDWTTNKKGEKIKVEDHDGYILEDYSETDFGDEAYYNIDGEGGDFHGIFHY
ncbi:hypothetical protein BDZ94DRAFT_1278187 [Collybia nuda]|uniref:Uncharacterized protein n=1 Tax=Collybia nuda TaxID=64659 RepID=A0A9P6C809_9AGAR|nr:hypothetical protein BDZ94DRAFT_1278187 [Collybia nuda]